MTPLRRLALAAGILTALVGVVHAGVGLSQYTWPSFDALWFQGSGIALLLIGALSTLAASERAWRTVGAVALTANLLGLGLGVAFGTLSRWSAPQGPLLIALFAAGALGCVPSLKHP
jgi:asparagine N-glycosylation enzyme membrane subunit Stt3